MRMRHLLNRLALAGCALFAVLSVTGVHAAEIPGSWLGAWKATETDEVIRFEQNQIVLWREGKLRVLSLLQVDPPQVVVRRSGLLENWTAEIQGKSLTVKQSGEERRYRRLPVLPEVVRVDPLALGPATPLPAERVLAIQQEISERLAKDQATIASSTLKPEQVKAVLAENSERIRSLAQEMGWIDAGRFGAKTSYGAVILAKHGGDLRLLLAALPWIEQDFRLAGDDAQAFAIAYDTLQLDLGKKQRYGTQIRDAGKPKPFVLPLEDAARVDTFRKEIGLPTLAQYLADAGKVLGTEISMPPQDDRHPNR